MTELRSARNLAPLPASVAIHKDIAYDAEETMVQEWMRSHFDRLTALQMSTLPPISNTPFPTAPARPDW